MAKQGPTPEEQLLKLIEKGDEAGTARFKRRRKLFLNFGGLRNLWRSLIKAINQPLIRLRKGLREPNLKAVNKFFLILSVILLGYSIVGFVFGRPDIRKVREKSRLIKEEQSVDKDLFPPRPFLHYLEMVRRRNIFSPVTLKEGEKPEVKEKKLLAMAANLKLVGISLEKEPVAMIEDIKAKKTYFLKAGDTINKFKVDTISNDRVILNYRGDKIELM